MILLGEGGENEFNTNLNFLLEQYGMTINGGRSIVKTYSSPQYLLLLLLVTF